MTQKITARFFTLRRTRGGHCCFIRDKQAGSIFRDGSKFWAACADKALISDQFDTFPEAEAWLWAHYATLVHQ